MDIRLFVSSAGVAQGVMPSGRCTIQESHCPGTLSDRCLADGVMMRQAMRGMAHTAHRPLSGCTLWQEIIEGSDDSLGRVILDDMPSAGDDLEN